MCTIFLLSSLLITKYSLLFIVYSRLLIIGYFILLRDMSMRPRSNSTWARRSPRSSQLHHKTLDKHMRRDDKAGLSLESRPWTQAKLPFLFQGSMLTTLIFKKTTFRMSFRHTLSVPKAMTRDSRIRWSSTSRTLRMQT